MLHAANAVSHGYKRILIIAKDTDILVLGISFFDDIGADKLSVSFGIGNKLRNISIRDICSTMSSAKVKEPSAPADIRSVTSHFRVSTADEGSLCVAH